MSKNYQISSEFLGFQSKRDKTNMNVGVLVPDSQNVLVNDAEKIETRGGYTLQSSSDNSGNTIESSVDWLTTQLANAERVWNVRSYDDELEIWVDSLDGDTINEWKRLEDGWSNVSFVFSEGGTYFDSTETLDLLLFVNGDSNMYEWNGAAAVVDSTSGGNTITKKGTSTWAENRFYTTRNKTLVNTRTGNEHTYTGGEATTTLTGVNNTTGLQQGDVLVQKVVTNSNTPASGYQNDVLRVQVNQVWVGSNSDTQVYVSKDDDHTDFTFSSPRQPGEGALITLDGITRGFARFQEDMAVFAGRDLIYKSSFEQLDVSGTLVETLRVKKLKTTAEQAAQSQGLIAEVGDSVAFLTFEPELRMLANIEEIDTPQIRTLSDQIRPTLEAGNFSNGHMKFYKNRLYISEPANSKAYILEFREREGELTRFWQPPQILPVRRWAIIDDSIHGHSNGGAETFKLFNGTDDNGLPFTARAAFAYLNYDNRVNLKRFTEWFLEGYISRNTTLDVTFNYEYEGSKNKKDVIVRATDDAIIFEDSSGQSLGQLTLGGGALGGGSDDSSDTPKFAALITLTPEDFRELQVIYTIDEVDEQFELLAHGANALQSRANNVKIKI